MVGFIKCFNYCKESCVHAKCDKKLCALVICILMPVLLLAAIIMFSVAPHFLKQMYNFKVSQTKLLTLFVVSATFLLVSNIILLIGLIKKKSWCVFIWLIIMITSWNFHLGYCIISIVNYLMDGIEKEITEVPYRLILLFVVHVPWLVMICIVWYYWRNSTTVSDVQSLVEYIRERSNDSIQNNETIPVANTISAEDSTAIKQQMAQSTLK